jgi:hypothetical protein
VRTRQFHETCLSPNHSDVVKTDIRVRIFARFSAKCAGNLYRTNSNACARTPRPGWTVACVTDLILLFTPCACALDATVMSYKYVEWIIIACVSDTHPSPTRPIRVACSLFCINALVFEGFKMRKDKSMSKIYDHLIMQPCYTHICFLSCGQEWKRCSLNVSFTLEQSHPWPCEPLLVTAPAVGYVCSPPCHLLSLLNKLKKNLSTTANYDWIILV